MAGIDDELREAGSRWRAQQSDPVVDLKHVTTHSRSPRVLVAIAAIVIVATGAVVAVAARKDPGSHVTVAPTTTSSAAVPPPDVIELNSEIVQPDVLAVDGTRLWVTGYAPAPNGTQGPAHLQQIDSKTGRVLGDITLPDDSPLGIRISSGVAWVAAQKFEELTELLKIDIDSMRMVARVPGVVSTGFDVDAGTVWSPDGVGALRRIDAATTRVVATIPVHKFGIYAAGGVVAGRLGVFVANGYDGVIQRIDEATNTAGPEIHVAEKTASMVELGDSLWVLTADGMQVVEVAGGERPAAPISLGERGYGLASDGAALWLGTESSHVLRVDPATGTVSRVALPAGTRALTVAADPSSGAVWATSSVPTPRLLRVPLDAPPTSVPLTSTTVSTRGCGPRDDCPPPDPIPCPEHRTEPSMDTGSFCGPAPGAGNGLGPAGECTGDETVPPCGPGMVPSRYYEYTLPGRCDGRLILNGKHWLSTLPPSTNGPSMKVWVAVQPGGKTAGFISPNGAVGFVPDTGQPSTGCGR